MCKSKHKQDAASIHTIMLKVSVFRCDDAIILQTDGTRASTIHLTFHAKKMAENAVWFVK